MNLLYFLNLGKKAVGWRKVSEELKLPGNLWKYMSVPAMGYTLL